MKTLQNPTEKRPITTIGPALNEYRDKIMFPEKYEKAKEVFRTAKLPPNKNR